MSLNLSRPILYLITRGASTEQTTPASPAFQQILRQISAAVEAGIDLIQLREKRLNARVLFELTARAASLVHGTATRVLVNDRADIAAGAGASGVHLTTQSIDAATTRKIFGDDFLIGVSTHSLDEAIAARECGADFIVFGPVYATSSKEQYGRPAGLENLSEVVRELGDFPVLALGGISISNARACFKTGSIGIAGISIFAERTRMESVAAALRESAKEIS